MAQNKKRVLSGMRPTGKLHLGHLLGALRNWNKLQAGYECFFMVADWHALMSEYENPVNMKENIIDNVIDWLACGISEKESTIFIQSQVKEHLELYMVFSTLTPLGWLERCPTYKEQLREVANRDLSTYGFLGYPVLQAADILIYKASCVPVGEDQLPHLELTREIARRFNSLYKAQTFPEPQALMTESSRLLGLDGRKMSKSYNNTIMLSDTAEAIRNKVKDMFTDPSRIKLSDPGHPDDCNVYSYHSLFSDIDKSKEIHQMCQSSKVGCTDCKKYLADSLIKFLEPIQARRGELVKDKNRINKILKQGQEKAQAVAANTLFEVRHLLGM